MRLLWLAALCAALGIGCLLTPWHIAMTGVCLLLLAGVMAACCLLRGERGKRWRRVLWSLAALGMEPYGIGSRTTPWILKVNYELREVFSYVKALAQAG